MKVHNMFYAKLLRKDPNNPVLGQTIPPLEPVTIDEQDEWVVELIRASKLRYGKLLYRANWQGADEDPEYYPASNFMYSPYLLQTYHLEHPAEPGPPTALLL